jgi:Trypsin-co-occurring domain 1
MAVFIEYPLEGGGQITIETAGQGSKGPVLRGGSADTVTKAAETFENAIAVIQPVANALLARFRRLEQGPESIDIKFGLKFSAEAGAIIASASTEANIEVMVRWRNSMPA